MKKNGGNLICIICKSRFYVCNRRLKTAKWCSKECWDKRNPPLTKRCLYCGTNYLTYGKERKTKKFCSMSCRNKDYKKRNGVQSHLWKGGLTEKNKILRTRAEYQNWRNSVFQRDNYLCKLCGGKGHLQAHHIKQVCNNPDLIYSVDNGLTLCILCHQKQHPDIVLHALKSRGIEKYTSKKAEKIN